MAGLAPVGQISYNGFTFPPANKSRVTYRPIYDSTERVIKYDEITLTINFVAHEDLPTLPNVDFDTDMRVLMLRLSAPHQTLRFDDQGLGDIYLPINFTDVANGPKPRIIHWEPIVAGKMINIGWEVTFTLARCSFSDSRAISEFTYAYDWSIDADGLTTRSITGFLEVASSFQANIDRVVRSADEYRSELRFAIPEGFLRTTQNYSLSPDRRRLSFSIVDQQINSRFPYARGVKAVNLTQRLSTQNLRIGQIWSTRISGSIALFTAAPKHLAWMAFADVIRSRRNAINANIKRDMIEKHLGEVDLPPIIETNSFMITREFEIEDDIFGDEVSFRIVWDIYSNRTQAFAASGMFVAPDSESTWADWAAYNEEYKVGTLRGIAELSHAAASENILHLCNPLNSTANLSPANLIPTTTYDSSLSILPDSSSGSGDYIHYESDANLIREPGDVYQTPLRDRPQPYEPTEVPPSATLRNPSYTDSMSYANYFQPSIRQVRHSPQFDIVFRGSAIRINAPVVLPEIVSFQGVPVTPIGRGQFRQRRRIQPMGQVFYLAAWEQRYRVQSSPYGKPLHLAEVPNVV